MAFPVIGTVWTEPNIADLRKTVSLSVHEPLESFEFNSPPGTLQMAEQLSTTQGTH